MKLEGAGHRAAVSLCGARLCDESLCVHGGERLLEGEDMVEQRGEGEDLRLVVVRLREGDLGRHVPERACSQLQP